MNSIIFDIYPFFEHWFKMIMIGIAVFGIPSVLGIPVYLEESEKEREKIEDEIHELIEQLCEGCECEQVY
jgi:hypothetical protein